MFDADLHAEAERLELLARATGERAYERAARALRQQTPRGRPPIDDFDMLSEALALRSAGAARSLHAAFLAVARARGVPREKRRGVAERLRRRHKKIVHQKVLVDSELR